MEKVKEEFPEGFFRDPSYTDPDWLIDAYKAYYLANGLEEIKAGIKIPKEKVKSNLIKIMVWKLYEC